MGVLMLPGVAMGVRGAFGIVLGIFLALAGLFVGWLIAPPGPQIPSSLLLSAAGIGGGIGGFVGWLTPEERRRVIVLQLCLALAAGIAGAWLGALLGEVVYPKGVNNPMASFRTPAFIVSVAVSSLVANLIASGYYAFRLGGRREI